MDAGTIAVGGWIRGRDPGSADYSKFGCYFEGPQDAEDTDGLRLLDIEPSGQATNVETVAAAASRATTGLADRGGFSTDAFEWTHAALL